jgi:hypothetical protein
MAIDALLLDPDRQVDALETPPVHALTEKDQSIALRYADRRCRITPLAQSHLYLLRAEALRELSQTEAALADVSVGSRITITFVVGTHAAWAECKSLWRSKTNRSAVPR